MLFLCITQAAAFVARLALKPTAARGFDLARSQATTSTQPSTTAAAADHGSVQDVPALRTALEQGSCIVLDASDWGVLTLQGEDRLRFLHSQTSNAFTNALPGQILPTCVLTATGRTLDYCTALILQNEVQLICSPERVHTVFEIFSKHLFPLEAPALFE